MTEPIDPAAFATSGPIDLKIVGDVSALYDLSRSISTVHDRLDDVANRIRVTPENMTFFWKGASFDSFTYAASQHADAISIVASFAKDASSIVDAYGGLLERGRNLFSGYADTATAANLTVTDARYIQPPTAPASEAGDTDTKAADAKSKHEHQVKLFQEIRDLVAMWRADLESWINEYFGPLLGRVSELDAVDDLIKNLRDAGLASYDALAAESDKRISEGLSEFLDEQQKHEARWQEHQKDGRSRVPARIARGEKYDEHAHRAARDSIDADIKKLGVKDFLVTGGKTAGVLGGIAAGAYDIYSGESPSKVAAGAVGGAAGGAAGAWAGGKLGASAGAAVGTFLAPGAGTVAGAIGGAVVGVGLGAVGGYWGAEGSQTGWESWVSLRSRQAIDEGLLGKYQISAKLDPHRRNFPEIYGTIR